MADSVFWTPSTWDQLLHGFCESSLDIEHEIVNTFSSLFIVFWGTYGLYQLPSTIYQRSDIWQLLYNLLICVGIGSILFHWTLYIGYGLLDSLPMLLAEFVGLFQLIQIVLEIKLRKKNMKIIVYDIFSKTMGVILTLLALLSIIFTALYGQHHEIFIILFALVPILILLVSVWAVLDPGLLKDKIKSSSQYKLIFRHLWTGFGLAAFAGIIWNVTERLCVDYPFIAYFPAHGLWHLFIGYGMYNLVQTGIFVDFDNNLLLRRVSVEVKESKEGKNKFQKIWYFLVPVLEVHSILDDERDSDDHNIQLL
eukprot:6097_1